MAQLSDNIRSYRKKHKLTQTEFANRLHVTKQAVSKWETGRGYPDSSIIPAIAKELDITIDELMGESRIRTKTMIRSVLIVVLVLTAIFTSPILIYKYREAKQYNEIKNDLETQLFIDIPDRGVAVNTGLNNWISYGNSLQVQEMSYLILDDNNQTHQFEQSLEGNTKWINELNDELLNLIPSHLQDYSSTGDYFIIYNIDNDSYNDSLVEPGRYQYMFIVYQLENNRLIFFDYFQNVEE